MQLWQQSQLPLFLGLGSARLDRDNFRSLQMFDWFLTGSVTRRDARRWIFSPV